MQKKLLQGREVILEFQQFGNIVKVSAMDVKSLTEISIQGPSSTAQSILENNALRRLEYVLKKKHLL